MKIALRIILLAVLAALSVWLWLVVFPGPEKVIRKRLTEIARTASFSSNQSDLARLAAAQGLAGCFATNIEVSIDVPGHGRITLSGRDEIMQTALAARGAMSGLSVKFPDINVTVEPDKQSAVADLTLEGIILGETDHIVQEMKFTLQKIDGQWLITRVETIRTLSRRRPGVAHHFEL